MKANLLGAVLLLAIIIIGCKENHEPKEIIEIPILKERLNTYDSDIIKIENVLINGQKVILPIEKFNSVYKAIDSSKTELWECGSPFEWLDSDWMTEKYGKVTKESGTFENFDGNITTLYGKQIEFNTNNHIVLFNTAFAKSNSIKILSHNIELNKDTSLKDFQKMFPKSEMEQLDNPGEVRFRFYVDKEVDDAFLFYFKDGKLDYFSLWWLLC